MKVRYVYLLAALLFSSNLEAGQLHVIYLNMSDFARFGYITLGVVVSVDVSKSVVIAKIKKVWLKKNEYNQNVNLSDMIGQTQEYTIYGGVVWDDPGMSPIDQRVMGAIDITALEKGMEVIFVPNHGYEMLAAEDKTLSKLDLFFSESGLSDYKNNSPAERLYRDLNDFDLKKPALEAMCERDLLSPKAFLDLGEREMFDLGWDMRDMLSDKKYDAWFLSLVNFNHTPEQRKTLMDISRESLVSPKLSLETKMTLYRKLDLTDSEQSNYIRWMIRDSIESYDENNPLKLNEKTAEILADFSMLIIEHQRFDDYREKQVLKEILSKLPEKVRLEKIKKIGELIMLSKEAEDSENGYDDNLFDIFLELNKEYPSIEYLPVFTSIDISGISSTSQSKVDNHSHLLDAAWFLSQNFPESKKEIYKIFEKWAEDESLFDPELIMSIDSESPSQKRERWKTSLKRFKSLAEN